MCRTFGFVLAAWLMASAVTGEVIPCALDSHQPASADADSAWRALGSAPIYAADEYPYAAPPPRRLGPNVSFGLSAGYANFDSNSAAHLLHDRNGAYIDSDFAWRLPGGPVYLGAGVSGSGFFKSKDVLVPIGGGVSAFTTLYSDVGLFSVEARIATIIAPQGAQGFFLMPRLGMGLVLNDYAIDHVFASSSPFPLSTTYHDGVAFGIRPSVQAGYSWGPIVAGAEASYMIAWGDFGQLGNVAREFRVGAFVRFQW